MGADVDLINKKTGETWLHLAVSMNSLSMVRALVELGADIEKEKSSTSNSSGSDIGIGSADNGYTPLMLW